MHNKLTQFSTTIECDHFPTCSGCEFQKDVDTPPIWEEARAFFEQCGQKVPLIVGDVVGWRMRAKLAVRGSATNPLIGLFKRGSHEVIPLLDCPLHHPSINQGLQLLRDELIKAGVVPYDEVRGRGILRYIQMVVERKAKRVQLVLVVQAVDPSVQNLIQALSASPFWHSIWLNFQKGSTNTIFGKEWLHCHGEVEFWENLLDRDICFHPACFAQAHLNLFEEMLLSIRENILPDRHCVEYYAGVGAIGLSVLEKTSSLTLNEIAPLSQECFNKSLSRLSGKATFHLGPAEEHTSLLSEAQVVILDPPRRGIAASLKEKIYQSPTIEQLIYVSCSWKSFHRDCLNFLEKGWTIEKAEAYLFFPGTDEVEILCFFRKNSG